jgi:hypothetical protein
MNNIKINLQKIIVTDKDMLFFKLIFSIIILIVLIGLVLFCVDKIKRKQTLKKYSPYLLLSFSVFLLATIAGTIFYSFFITQSFFQFMLLFLSSIPSIIAFILIFAIPMHSKTINLEIMNKKLIKHYCIVFLFLILSVISFFTILFFIKF